MTVEDFEATGAKVVMTDGGTSGEMLQDGQADLMIAHTGMTSSTVTELVLPTNGIIVSGLSARS